MLLSEYGAYFRAVLATCIVPFWEFWADFNPPKQGSKSTRNPPLKYNVIKLRLKKRKKIASTRLRFGDAIFVRFFNRCSMTH